MGTADELHDIFGVPTDGSNIDTDEDTSDESQEGAYSAVLSGSENATFEEKAAVVSQAIATSNSDQNTSTQEPSNEQAEPGGEFESIISAAKDASQNASRPQSDDKVETDESPDSAPDEPENIESDVHDDGAVSESNEEAPASNEEEKAGVSETTEEVEASEEAETSKVSDPVEANLRAAGFLLDAPTRTYEAFYRMKEETLRRYLKEGKKLPIDKWTEEMRNAFVSIKISFVDRDAIADKMTAIQNKRDRVVQIKSMINSQFFLWKRIIPMMHGQLARIIYEKPAAKQDGVNYEHMRDMEEYFNDLEGIYETSKDILNNLDAAYDSLSRQVTLALPTQSIGVVGSSSKDETTKGKIDPDDYDGLDDKSVKVAVSEPKTTKKSSDGPEEASFF
jgi:RNAse (barnase) inhibitor barstar